MTQKQRRAVSCKDAIRHRQGVLSGATHLGKIKIPQSGEGLSMAEAIRPHTV